MSTGGDTATAETCGQRSTACRDTSRRRRVAKHRLFVWLDARICPDSATDRHRPRRRHDVRDPAQPVPRGLVAPARDEARKTDPRYTPTTTFETFPFPPGLAPDVPATEYASDPRAIAIADAARRLVNLRDRWLNPPEWVEWVDEPVSGYPKRPVPRDEAAAKALKKRTLTNLYTRPGLHLQWPRWEEREAYALGQQRRIGPGTGAQGGEAAEQRGQEDVPARRGR